MLFNSKDVLNSLYKNEEYEEMCDAKHARNTIKYLSSYLQKKLDISVEDIAIGREIIGTATKYSKPITSPIGVILSKDLAGKVEKILSDRHIERFNFRIIEGANSSGGITEENKVISYKFSLNSSNEKNLRDFTTKFIQKYGNVQGIREVRGQILDYLILEGEDSDISGSRIFIEIGRTIPGKKSLFPKSFAGFIGLPTIKDHFGKIYSIADNS